MPYKALIPRWSRLAGPGARPDGGSADWTHCALSAAVLIAQEIVCAEFGIASFDLMVGDFESGFPTVIVADAEWIFVGRIDAIVWRGQFGCGHVAPWEIALVMVIGML